MGTPFAGMLLLIHADPLAIAFSSSACTKKMPESVFSKPCQLGGPTNSAHRRSHGKINVNFYFELGDKRHAAVQGSMPACRY
ncbi:hypothetical protein [Collimonas sp. OK242]|uniref:hypothetical protein n=1 Tax=Collimonas sp. OK242 TaxID=1798195 RepID=UPI000B809CA4|nr:hypothetical protein [Collimonas sp. OK242]